jgi:hypothetical protein
MLQGKGHDLTTTVPGIYREGKIELLTAPSGIREGPVLVTLEEVAKDRSEPRLLPFGEYREGRESTEEDFKIAEWHGELQSGEQ